MDQLETFNAKFFYVHLKVFAALFMFGFAHFKLPGIKINKKLNWDCSRQSTDKISRRCQSLCLLATVFLDSTMGAMVLFPAAPLTVRKERL